MIENAEHPKAISARLGHSKRKAREKAKGQLASVTRIQHARA